MTRDELEELRRLEKEATPGPWHFDNSCFHWLRVISGGDKSLSEVETSMGQTLANRALVVALRNYAKELIAAYEGSDE